MCLDVLSAVIQFRMSKDNKVPNLPTRALRSEGQVLQIRTYGYEAASGWAGIGRFAQITTFAKRG
ncbi:hypothetical protein DS909_05660 [Phaeobacter gallaeciensis]|uniref:Uncharacterized protein n=1 Tax=Phaeobacter gallaeciensis TaxID=60890 RepID=A0A366X5Y3_9RHOB|nr:hypothetical protein DS909_05660 [Phaeobacter gallaeciensis]